ncbi:LCP family protein [Streptomyces sp. CAU 1734]|uniref:LCP family protein n=1 Tax=Streptomyces sp. CAU 1734 TaxID=3140360 RepID=UPI0032616D53
MDADVTESAGTPAGPDGPDEDERANDAGAGSGSGSAAGTGHAPDTSGTSNVSGGKDPDDPSSGSEKEGEKSGTAPDAEADPETPAESGTEAETPAEAEPGTEPDEVKTAASVTAEPHPAPAPAASPAPPRRKRHWVRWAALGTSVVVLAASGVAWWAYQKLNANITTDTTTAAELRTHERERPRPIVLNAQNILLIGSDTRSGKGNRKYGRDDGGSQRSDTTILLHVAADRKSATAMSIPRDLMAEIPSCRASDGSRTSARFAQFNSAFQLGGAACAIRTVEKMTGVRVDHHIVVDFRGFKKMVDAVGGVEICLKKPIDDPDAKLKLPAGRQKLDGEQALGYVRARKTLGDGSDTDRMARQQQFMGALVKKVQSNGVLLNFPRLYRLLDAATKSLTTDPGLDSLQDLTELVRSLGSVPTEKVQFLTVPRQPYAADRNRDELVQPDAGQLFAQLRADDPITVLPDSSRDSSGESDEPDGAEPSGAASASPTFPGTNAAVGTCK